MREIIEAIEDIEAEDAGEERFAEFKLTKIEKVKDEHGNETGEEKRDERVLRAYAPTPAQLTFLMTALGRGQTDDQRMAGMVNVMMSCLRDEDKDYFESRLLDRNPKTRLAMKTVERVFEGLIEDWFARPTQESSGSTSSPPSDSPN